MPFQGVNGAVVDVQVLHFEHMIVGHEFLSRRNFSDKAAAPGPK
jgi:hypothetical protein